MEEWIRRDGEKKEWTGKENRQEEAWIVEDILDMTRRKNKRERERGGWVLAGWLVCVRGIERTNGWWRGDREGDKKWKSKREIGYREERTNKS